jgi:putative membrane protein
MSRSFFVVFALIAVLGTACNRDADRATGTTPGEGGGLSGAANPPTGEVRLSASEQEFVQKAAKSNQMEVDIANMADDKAANSNVKDYAEQLERDHSDVLDDLRRIANRADVNLDTTPPVEKASMDNKLNAASGRAFDREYISMMIENHKKGIADFERMQSTATGELKAFIDKTLPVMREHLQKAETLSAEVSR